MADHGSRMEAIRMPPLAVLCSLSVDIDNSPLFFSLRSGARSSGVTKTAGRSCLQVRMKTGIPTGRLSGTAAFFIVAYDEIAHDETIPHTFIDELWKVAAKLFLLRTVEFVSCPGQVIQAFWPCPRERKSEDFPCYAGPGLSPALSSCQRP